MSEAALVSKLEAALDLARHGLKVFPALANTKKAIPARFYACSTADPAKIEAFWTQRMLDEVFEQDHNVAVSTDEIVVVDIDVKKQSLDRQVMELDTKYGLPDTWIATTPSGGEHWYYCAPQGQAIHSSRGMIQEGVDIKGWHSYVIGPGSILPDGAYAWKPGYSPDDLPLAELPASIIEKCDAETVEAAEAKAARKGSHEPLCELDLPENIAKAQAWLRDEAPEAIENSGGRDATMQVIFALGDFGLSPDKQVELLAEEGGWNEEKAHPPWDVWGGRESLDWFVRDLWGRRERAPGCERVVDVTSEFDAVPDVVTESKRRGLFLRSWEESRGRALTAAANPLIKRLLSQGGMSVVYGESNTGKTFAALHLAASVAVGAEWNGWRVKQTPVVYVAAEAGEDINPRVEALARYYGWVEVPLGVVPCPVNLLDGEADMKALLALIRGAGETYGAPVGLIVIDTLSRALAGGDENSSVDMGKLVRHIDALRAATGAHVLLVHHSGKDKARGARGHSLLRAATDTEIEVEPGKMRVTKQRGMQGGQEIHFRLAVETLGRDTDGEDVTSCAFTIMNEFEVTEEEQRKLVDRPLTKKQAEWWASIEKAVEAESERLEVPKEMVEISLDFYRNHCATENGFRCELSDSTIQYRLEKLTELHRISKGIENQWFIAKPKLTETHRK